jgi:ABC-type transport system substrate-binding protein
LIGTRLADRYEITAELGRGGMGVVYRARDPVLNRDVAVKLVPPSLLNKESEQRFQREAQLVAQMDHPAIVSIFDFGRHGDSLFFLMPLVQGTSLHAFLRGDAVLGDILDVGIQVAEALDYSHTRGVIHRDIKPDNIMVSREEGSGVRVRVMDFGLARGTMESGRLTKSGAVIGTLSYLSPEQVAARPLDARSDVYALGVVLYECVMGSVPFSGEAQAILYRIVHDLPQPPRSLGAEIDEDLEALILRCLEKEPARRPQRAAEVAEALRRYRAGLRDSDRTRSLASLTQTFQAQRPVLSPFVGRSREFADLQQRLNAATAGECQFVVVAGEAGIGKTRLLDELEKLANARGVRVLHGRSVEQDRSFPYQGFCEIIQDFFRVKDAGSTPPPDFSDLAADLLALFPMLSEISEIRAASAGGSTAGRAGGTQGPEDRTQIFELLARTLTRIGGGRPLVLFLEDLHAAEVSIDALPYIVRRLGPTPTLVVGSYRSTEVDRGHPLTRMLDSFRGDRRFSLLTLGPFSPSEHRSFLETLVGGSGIGDSLAGRLYEGTEGNPFFTKELMRSLLDSGSIARDDTGAWGLSGEAGISADTLPATIQQAVEKRIEGLPAELLEILSVASVIGRTFDDRDFESLAPGKDIDDAIDRLVELGLIEEERGSRGDRLSFSSGVVRDVLYTGLPPRKRRSLHRKYAELLETRHGGRLERALPQLVLHFSEGDVPDKTVEYALRLAKASLDAFSADEAARSAKTALSFLDEEWEGPRSLEGEARLLLARAHRMAGDVDGALREAAAAVRVFEQERQPARETAALFHAAETAWLARRTEEARRWVERGLAAARVAGEPESLRQVLSLAATLSNLVGEYARANEYVAEAARLGAGPGEAEADKGLPTGGTLVVALAEPVTAREPGQIRTIEEEEVLANVFETLIATDAAGHVMPALCERWEARDGGRTFLLSLRDRVRFQDGGPLTAADVKASFERSIRRAIPEVPAAFTAIRGVQEFIDGAAEDVAGIAVRSDRDVEIQLMESLPIYPAFLSHRKTAVLRGGRGEAAPVGTGPFRIASHAPERVVLERSPDYWKGTPAPLDGIEFRVALRSAAIASGLRSGEFDVVSDLLPGDLEEILRDPRFRRGLVEVAKENSYFALFNSGTGPIARNSTVRRALCSVLRTQDLVWRTLGRFAQPAVCLIPPGMLGHDPGRRIRSLTRDQAVEMLAEAGATPPLRLKAAVHPLLQDRYGSLLEAVFSTWAELGVEVSVETRDIAQYLRSWQESAGIDLLIGRWNADYDDPDNFTHGLFHSRVGLLKSYFCSTESDQILEEARSEMRPAIREALYRKFESLLLETGTMVPLFHDIDYRVTSPKVRGLVLRGTAPYVNYASLGKGEPAEAPAETRPASGGTLQVPVAGVVTSLDPSLASTTEQAEVLRSIFETLTRTVGGFRVVPWLASELRAEEGGRRYHVRLRDDVRFHDGRRLTSRDVRYSFERILLSRASEFRWFLSPIKGAKVLLEGGSGDLQGIRIHSASELTIDLDEPVSFFPALLSYEAASILPEGSDPSASPVGSGPFRVIEFAPGARLQLERNPDCWVKGLPLSEALVFSFGVPPKEILAGFRSGRFSLCSDLFPEDVEALRREPEFAAGYREGPRLSTCYAAFNVHRGPLSDKGLRQRLVSSVDVARLVRQSLGRLAIPAQGLIPPGLLGHDPAAARTAVAPSGRVSPPAEIELATALNPVFFKGYSALARGLEKALGEQGVRFRIVNSNIAEFEEAESGGSVDVSVGRWISDYPDADTFVHLLHSREGSLGRLCSTPEIDPLVERGRAETSPSVRHGLYRQVEQVIARDALLLPLFHEQAYRFARPEVEGISASFWGQTVAYENLRVRG